MTIYKVFYKNYDLRKGELLGVLIERRKDFRGTSKIESGLKWARLTFGSNVLDREAIFVVPEEVRLKEDTRWPMEKAILTHEEFLEAVKIIEGEMKERGGV